MLFRGWIDGKWFITGNLELLDSCESVDALIRGIWQVWR